MKKTIKDNFPEFKTLFNETLAKVSESNKNSTIENTMSVETAKMLAEYIKNDFQFTEEIEKRKKAIRDIVLLQD